MSLLTPLRHVRPGTEKACIPICMTAFSAPYDVLTLVSANWQQCEKMTIDVSFHQKIKQF